MKISKILAASNLIALLAASLPQATLAGKKGACPEDFQALNEGATVSEVFEYSTNGRKRSVSLSFDNFSTKDAALLAAACKKALEVIKGEMPLPKEISFVNDGMGPVYDFFVDGIHATFPISKEISSAKSVPIHLHEMFHQIFFQFARDLAKKEGKPRLLWSFAVQDSPDNLKMSKQLIRKGLASDPLFRGKSEEQDADTLLARYSEISSTTSAVQEMLADLSPILVLKDPDAIYKSLPKSPSEDTSIYRRAGIALGKIDLEKISDRDLEQGGLYFGEYSNTAFARAFVWQELYQNRFLKGRLPVSSLGALIAGLHRSSVETVGKLTADFSKDAREELYYSPAQLNKNLIEGFCREFRISPCPMPQVLLDAARAK